MTSLNIVLSTSGNPTITIPIPAALLTLDSTAQGSSQTGYSAVDQLVRSIFRAGVFTDGTKWYAASTILTVTAS